MSVLTDPRWVKLHGPGVICACGYRHTGLFPLQMIVPLGWVGAIDYEAEGALRMDGDFLSANFCVREGKYFAIRARMPLPIREAREHAMVFTVWISLQRLDFEAYVNAAKTGALKQGLTTHARLVNRVGGYADTAGMMGLTSQQLDGPPYFLANQETTPPYAGHALPAEQRQGVTLDRLFEIYLANGHDMRADLPST